MPARLTPKERLCLEGVARHLQAAEIAHELGLAQTTVETHLANARRKLGVTSSRAAVRLVFDSGLHTRSLEGFSAIRSGPSVRHPLPQHLGGYDIDESTDYSRLVQQRLGSGTGTRRAATDIVGCDRDRDRRLTEIDPATVDDTGVVPDALAGKHPDGTHGASSTASDHRVDGARSRTAKGADSGRDPDQRARDGADAAVELYGCGSRPDLYLAGVAIDDRDTTTPRIAPSSWRANVSTGHHPSTFAAGFRFALSSDSKTPDLIEGPRLRNKAGGSLSPLLLRALVVMGIVLAFTIPVATLLTARNFSVWLHSLLYG